EPNRRLAPRGAGGNGEPRPRDPRTRELGVDAAELLRTALVAGLDLDPAERQRRPVRLDRAKAGPRGLCRSQEVEVDLDVEDVVHAAHVGVAELLERGEERAAA